MAAIGPTSKEEECLITVLKTGYMLRKVKDAHSGRLVNVPADALARANDASGAG